MQRHAFTLATRAAVSLLALSFVVLLGRNMWGVFPLSTSTGDARVQVWFGPDGAKYAYLALAIVVALAIVLAAWIGITSVTNQGCEIGLAIGLVSGVVIGGAYLVDFGTGSVVAQLDPPFALTLSGLFMAPALAGVLAARGTANPVAGGVAGFWAGLIGALVVIVVAIAAMQLFAGRLEAGPWLHDPNVAHMRNCSGAVGARLGSCETGDIVGGLANGLLNAPTIGLVVGLIAGALMTRARSTLANVDLRALIGPISLCAAFFVLSTLEIRLNLW